MGTRPRALVLGFVLAMFVVFATRWPLIPHDHLFHIDNVNDALALDEFNPALHQPQPPGDPLYIGLAKLLRIVISRPETLLPATGVLGSAVALILLWRIGTQLFGSRAGFAAALLLALNPIFWLAGVGNYVRTFLAAGAAAVGLLVWRCWNAKPEHASRMLYASAAVLGAAAGFRPELGLVLLPLVLSSIWIRRLSGRQVAIAFLCLAGTSIPWIAVTAAQVGGPAAFYRLNSGYVATQSRHSSLLYGASFLEAARMAAASIYWALLGSLSWCWFVPLALRPRTTDTEEPSGDHIAWPLRFLLFWFIPPFLFHTFVHIHNPDHALVSIPAVCLFGGYALSRLRANRFYTALTIAAMVNVILFFYPTGSPFWASNYRIAEYTIKAARDVYADLGELRRDGPLVVIWKDGFITPQEMSYYFTDVPIVTLPDAAAPLAIRVANVSRVVRDPGGGIVLPSNRVAWVYSDTPSNQDAFRPLGNGRPMRALRYEEFEPGKGITLSGFRLVLGLRSR